MITWEKLRVKFKKKEPRSQSHILSSNFCLNITKGVSLQAGDAKKDQERQLRRKAYKEKSLGVKVETV